MGRVAELSGVSDQLTHKIDQAESLLSGYLTTKLGLKESAADLLASAGSFGLQFAIPGIVGNKSKQVLDAAHKVADKVKAGVANAQKKKTAFIPGTNSGKKVSNPLLKGEGRVDDYGTLINKFSKPGDNLSAHHMPHDNYMKSQGVKRTEGIAMMVEDPFPGSGGRHREIHKFLKKQDPSLEPRQALAQSVTKARSVYKEGGVYTPQIKEGVKEVIKKNKQTFPQLFIKD